MNCYIWDDFTERDFSKTQITTMNKSKVLIGLLLVFLNFNFVSCEDEPVDPALLIPNPEVLTCAQPSALSASSFAGNSVNVTWTAIEGAAWEVQYGLSGFVPGEGTSVSSSTTSAMISGLNTSNNYHFYVRTLCSNGVFSDWTGPVLQGSSITTCESPTNFTALRSVTDTTKINVFWNANGDELSWEIQYGETGFAIGTGVIVSSNTTTQSITGLLATAGYDFYVRSNCSSTDNSVWIGPVHVNPAP